MPVDTAQCRASAMTRISRASRSGAEVAVLQPEAPVLKSENIASIPHLSP